MTTETTTATQTAPEPYVVEALTEEEEFAMDEADADRYERWEERSGRHDYDCY